MLQPELRWCSGVVVITTAQLHATKPELRFCAGSNPARGVSEIRDGEDLWRWPRLEIRLNAFRRSTIPQKQFIITIIIIRWFLRWFLQKKPWFFWYQVKTESCKPEWKPKKSLLEQDYSLIPYITLGEMKDKYNLTLCK